MAAVFTSNQTNLWSQYLSARLRSTIVFIDRSLPAPEKSAYRHVVFARFPVDDKPVYQDLSMFRCSEESDTNGIHTSLLRCSRREENADRILKVLCPRLHESRFILLVPMR